MQPAPLQILGHYTLLERVSVGGMAEVFRARDEREQPPSRFLAVKRVLPGLAEDAAFLDMFVEEARLAVQLHHANICDIFELGQQGDLLYLVMEFISGRDLLQVQRHLVGSSRVMSGAQAIHIVLELLAALDYAHRKTDDAGRPLGLVHRDISPQNVMLSFDGEVKLLDFGIARAGTGARRTRAGVLKGKFAYLSPEQAAGGSADHRSDLFAVGILLHELLTGARLFSAPTEFETLDRVRSLAPPSVLQTQPHLPPQLDAILARALAKAPDERFASASDFALALRALIAGQPQRFGTAELKAFMQREFPEAVAAEAAKRRDIASLTPSLEQADASHPSAPHTPVSVRTSPALSRAKPSSPAALRLLLPLGLAGAVALGAVALLNDTAGPATGETTIGAPVVHLKLSPPNTQVYLQGKRKLGAGSSQSFRIPEEGIAIVDLFADGMAPHRIEVNPATEQGLPREVTLSPPTARLVVTADAPADLEIDGSGVSGGSGAWTLAGLDPRRTYQLRLTPRATGFLPLERTVLFDGFAEQRLGLRLPRVGTPVEPPTAFGSLVTEGTDGPYRLLVDGRDTGLTAPIAASQPLPLRPGQRRITFARGADRKTVLVTIRDGQTAVARLPSPQPKP